MSLYRGRVSSGSRYCQVGRLGSVCLGREAVGMDEEDKWID